MSTFCRRIVSLGLCAVALVAAVPTTARATEPAGALQRFAYPDGRFFDLYVPTNLAASPELYVVLHGSGQHVDKAESSYGMEQLADAHHFLIAFPQGWHSLWNAGKCCQPAGATPRDDMEFLDRVIAQVQSLYPQMNPGIRMAGFSAGGMMAYTYACQRPDVVGVAGVGAAWMSTKTCARSPLRVYEIHGLADQLVPYLGGYSPFVGVSFEPVLELHTHFPAGSAFELKTWQGTHWWPDFAASDIYRWLG